MRKSIPLVAGAAFSVLLACEAGPGPAVIALAVGSAGAVDVRLAQGELGEESRRHVTFINDTVDDGTDSESEIARAYRFLDAEGLVGVVGHPGSRSSLVTAALYNEAEIVQIVPAGTSRRLRDVGPWTFTLAPNDSVEGAAIGAFAAEEMGARRAIVFFVTDEYGYGLREGVVAALEERGVEVLDEVPLRTLYQMEEADEGDLESLAQAALDRGRPDVVILAVRDFWARVIIPTVLTRFPEVRFIAGDGVLLAGENRVALGAFLGRIHQTVFWNPAQGDSLSASFVRRYRQETGSFPSHDHALFRDGLLLLAEAVLEVGSDPAEVREYVRSLGRDRPPFRGVTGPISFTPARAERVFLVRADSLDAR